jgi:polyhydroxyalkanoate synthesis regulator phasin
MNTNHRHCDRKEELVNYIYGECTANEERSFKQHIQECTPCRNEVAEFSSVRSNLQSWQLPESPRIVLDLAVTQPTRSLKAILSELSAFIPRWFKYSTAFAAACSILLVLLAALNTQIRYDQQGFSLDLALFAHQPAPPPVNNGKLDEEMARALVVKIINEKQATIKQELEQQIAQLTQDISEKNASALSRATLELKREQREKLQRVLYQLENRQPSHQFEDDPFSLLGALDEVKTRPQINQGDAN